MNLEELIADAKKKAKSPKKAPRSKAKEDYHLTKEQLHQMKLDACVPMAVHLRTTIQTCECGETYESVNSWPLIKRVSPSLVHFEAVKSQNPADLSLYDALPRVHEVRHQEVPWCETCFANATRVEVNSD